MTHGAAGGAQTYRMDDGVIEEFYRSNNHSEHVIRKLTGPNQTWEIGRVSMETIRYIWEIGRKQITTEYEKPLSLICFVNEFPKTKRQKYPQYTSE